MDISKYQRYLFVKNFNYFLPESESDDSPLATIASVLAIKLPTPNHPSLLPGINKKAVQHNGNILECNRFNLSQIIDKNRGSTMQYGSEFHPTAMLDKIFHSHRYWKRVRTNLEKGVHYNVKKLTKKKREENLRRALAYGNHKSAKDRPEACLELMEKEADLGYSACFPLEHAKNIVNRELYPV